MKNLFLTTLLLLEYPISARTSATNLHASQVEIEFGVGASVYSKTNSTITISAFEEDKLINTNA